METSSLDTTEDVSTVGPKPVDDEQRDAVEALADEFIARRRKGETPSLDEYIARCPDRAEEIRELFPAIAAMERWKPRPTPPRERPGGGPFRERIGEYRLIREIGRGGMGIVYEAEQTSLGRRVAIKMLPGTGWADDRPMQRFLREAKMAASLRHGNIVPVFAIGQEDSLHYYVMPLIEGTGLDRIVRELRDRKLAPSDGSAPLDSDVLSVARTLLDRPDAATSPDDRGDSTRPDSGDRSGTNPPSSPSEPNPRKVKAKAAESRHWKGIAHIGRQVAGALQHAHEQEILHRDIKPANLLLDAEGVVWVTDFGLAKAMSHDDLSRTGDLVGTLRYMAPERFNGDCDARSDVYSLGLTLYELLTLRPAHHSPERVELIKLIAEARPVRPRELDPSIPLDLETVVLKAIELDPKRRYASAGELADDLGRFIDDQPVLARRAAAPERLARWVDRNRALAALAAMSLILVLFSAYFVRYYLFVQPPPPQPPPQAKVEAPSLDDPELESFLERLDRPPIHPPPGGRFGGPPPPHPPGSPLGPPLRGGRPFGPPGTFGPPPPQ